ncbi:hypothetical protein [Absidia glauca]|uniref:Uncharacterized protein n=1 Tax=Absidia glauca TaxID=4829 RepID=A0A168KU25_ABSGL|nr:hypothetical protein [Absidia glauca]
MQFVFLTTTLLFTMAAAAVIRSNKPIVEIYYTDGKHIQQVNYDFGICLALEPQPGVWIDHKRLNVKSHCNYYYDSLCTKPTGPVIVHEPGEYKVEKVDQYAKCSIVAS